VPTPIKVLYIVGWKRSGSTILGNVIGEMPGFWHAGELRTVWGQGLARGRLCGCGSPLGECTFWADVVTDAAAPAAERVYAWQLEAVRMRNLRVLLKRTPLSGDGALASYAAVATSLYRSIASKTGARVIVDSSKQPADGALLGRLEGIDPYFIHLVRDPRAVAYSWQRRKRSPGEGAREEMMQVGAGRSTASWLFVDLAAELIRRRHGRDRCLVVRYEDFVTGPGAVVRSVADLVGEPEAATPEFVDGSVRLSANHTAGGNPGRFHSGMVELRADDEWMSKQAPGDRVVSTAVALPLLHRYRYSIRPNSHRASPPHPVPAQEKD
jgi:Sulfotransferase family